MEKYYNRFISFFGYFTGIISLISSLLILSQKNYSQGIGWLFCSLLLLLLGRIFNILDIRSIYIFNNSTKEEDK